jgi:hypothetical protein
MVIVGVQGIAQLEPSHAKDVILQKRPPNNITFKLRDPVSELFLSSFSNYSGVRFNTTGESWASVKTAVRKWGDYNLYRLLLNPDAPAVEVVKFKITATEQPKPTDLEPNLFLTAAYTTLHDYWTYGLPGNRGMIPGSLAVKRKYRIPTEVIEFVRTMADEHFHFKHIFDVSGIQISEISIPKNPNIRIMYYNTYRMSNTSDDADRVFVAVNTDKDYIYMKMLFSDFDLTIFDNAKIIAEYEEIRNTPTDEPLF